MSLWMKGTRGRRPQANPNGGVKPRPFRRAPYPGREERKEAHSETEGYEHADQQLDYSGPVDYDSYENPQHQPLQPHLPPPPTAGSPKIYNPGDYRNALYQRFYKQLMGDGVRRPPDCVVLSVNNQNTDYAKSLGHCLQQRGLSVEMIYLQAESGLTRALQDVRSNASPLCILVEQTNVNLSSCTVIIFSESLKIHRNMPKDQAMEFVTVEYRRVQAARRDPDPGEVAAQAAELTDDYLERSKLERHTVPSATRHLLVLMAEGLHLYPEELGTLTQYIRTRQDHLQASPPELDKESVPEPLSSLPAGLGKPPPLLPAPSASGPPQRERPTPPTGMDDHPPVPLMGAKGSYPKTKPPPLLSIHHGPPHRPPAPHGPHGPLPLRGPAVPHGPRGPPPPRGPGGPHHGPPRCSPLIRGPPSQNGPLGPRGPPPPRGPRAPPPSLKSLHMGSPPPGPLPRPPRHHLS
ncbi:nuclear receptor coactivator 5 [Chanos chanos]|uniref:Nuclear receptor coactivator 5 n=1 Tax=Chanos chanos TaxID=29144 RepID=A0A6J2UPR8_CHACN|nr:nuclear receptor coactivator 5-like [Chanos chanos]